MIRVVHLIVSLDRGGAELALLELIRERCPDIEQTVCSIKPDGSMRPAFERELENVHSLEIVRGADLRALPRLRRLVWRLRPTLLHTWMFHANVLGRVAGTMAGVPVVCSVRSLELGKPVWRSMLDRATSRLTAHTVAVSDAAAEVAIRRDGVQRERTTVIPNGVDIPPRMAALRGLAGGRIRVGAVGRLEPVKDHESLLRGFAQMAARQPCATLEIVGEGSQRPALEGLARALNIADRVALPGEIPNAYERMADWDMFVQPSLAEGMPRALLEAMATGLPVVATNVGGIPEAVGSSGILTPPHDPAALGATLLELVSNGGKARELGRTARERVAACFSRKAFVENHFALYRRLARGGA